MELENIILSKVSQAQREKVTSSPSKVVYRPKNCCNAIGHVSYTKWRKCTGEIGKRKKT
jgi:hypothetical protein